VVAAVLLFHVQVAPAAIALGACGFVVMAFPEERSRLLPLLSRAPWVIALTLPWLWLSWLPLGANWMPIESWTQLPARLGQFAGEATVAIPALGWIVGIPLLWRRLRPGDRALVRLCGSWTVLCAAVMATALSVDALKVVGIRYVCGLLPVAAAVTGVLVARAAPRSTGFYAALLALFAATHLPGNALGWLALGDTRRVAGSVSVNVPRDLSGKILNTQWWDFVRGLGVSNPGTLPALVGLLREHAEASDVVVTNYGWDNLYFYTDLPLGMRVNPEAPIRSAALELGLPAYVFGPSDVDWVVWRGNGDLLFGRSFADLRRELEARGASLELVGTVPETQWENRPELAWHRFPRSGYPFAPRRLGAKGARYPDAGVFRVRWTLPPNGALERTRAR
jgi:hypothetical protein